MLDASAVLRYLDGEAGAERVASILKEHIEGVSRAVISAIHWGEIAGIVFKSRGRGAMDLILSRLSSFGVEVVPATAEHAVRSALIKVEKKIPYADSFGVTLAAISTEHVLVTADFDVKPAEGEVCIEFLPVK